MQRHLPLFWKKVSGPYNSCCSSIYRRGYFVQPPKLKQMPVSYRTGNAGLSPTYTELDGFLHTMRDLYYFDRSLGSNEVYDQNKNSLLNHMIAVRVYIPTDWRIYERDCHISCMAVHVL